MLSRADRQKFAAQVRAVPSPSLVSPVRGWNTRDALDAMDPADAVLLDNFYPDAGGVNVRNGYSLFASGLGSPSAVELLAEYHSGSTLTFIAGAGGSVYDITSGTASSLASGFGSDAWMSIPFKGKLFLANGTDTLQVYDGSTVGNSTFTGVTLSTLVGGIAYQQRLFFWANSSAGFWFAPLNAITGALQFFDLSSFSPNGGNLIAAATYSHDGGNGVLDFICFIMSSGDCLIYYGNDPSNFPNYWQLIGIYRISPPVSRLAVCNYGAEAFLTTFDDHVPLQQQLVALKNGALPPRSKVSNAVQQAVLANSAAFGWQALYYPRGRRLIFNVPNVDGTFSQHVQNTGVSYTDNLTGQTTSPWCRFQNMNAVRWSLFNNKLYFGDSNGNVFLADSGTLDLLGAVNAIGQQAWNTFNDPLRKHLKAARPLVQGVASFNYSFDVGFDYGDLSIPTTAQVVAVGSPWDTSPWDTSPWSPELGTTTAWHASGGTGTAVSSGLNISTTEGASWLRTDFRYERGQYL